MNRLAIEAVFYIPRRTASRLLARIAADLGITATRTEAILIPTADVIAWLDRIENGQDYATERRRRAAVAQRLGQLKNDLLEARRLALDKAREEEAARVRFQMRAAYATRPSLEGLPDGVRIEPGKVTFSFDDPLKLYPMLLAFSQAVVADYGAFEAATSFDPKAMAERLRSGRHPIQLIRRQ